MVYYDDFYSEEAISPQRENPPENDQAPQNQSQTLYHLPLDNYNFIQDTARQEKLAQINQKYLQSLIQLKETKNIPKVIGTHFRNYLLSLDKSDKKQFNQTLVNFINKKKKDKRHQRQFNNINGNIINKKNKDQITYGLKEIKKILRDPKSNELFAYFLKDVLYLRFLQSNKIDHPEQYMIFIEQYASGCQYPAKFVSSRHHSQINKNKNEQIECQAQF